MGLTDIILRLAVVMAFVVLIWGIYKFCDVENSSYMGNNRHIRQLKSYIELQQQQINLRDQMIELLKERINVLEHLNKKLKENAQ